MLLLERDFHANGKFSSSFFSCNIGVVCLKSNLTDVMDNLFQSQTTK